MKIMFFTLWLMLAVSGLYAGEAAVTGYTKVGPDESPMETVYYKNGEQIAVGKYDKTGLEKIKGAELPEGRIIKYYPNGNVQAEQYKIKGKEIGTQKLYRMNGQKFYITNYDKTGIRAGKTSLYSKTGVLRAERNYKNGKLSGISKIYDEEGVLTIKTNYLDGKKDGVEEIYTHKSGLIVRKTYKLGKLVKEETARSVQP